MKVGIIFGGVSSEYSISLLSVASILKNISSKHELYLVGVSQDGVWYHFNGEIKEIEDDVWANNPNNEEVLLSTNKYDHGFFNKNTNKIDYVDVIYPIIHGRGGEDGCIPAICQLANLPIVSCDMTSSALAMDKEFTHIICQANGIPMANYLCFKRENDNDFVSMFAKCKDKLGLPFYVKPSKEGSSYGCHKINNYQEFVEGITDAYKYDRKILAEEFIDGTEIGTAILGEDEVGEVFEIVVETEMYGFKEKYLGYKTNIYTPSKTLSKEKQDEVKELSLKVYKMMDCHVLARIDFFNSSKGIIFNELNTIPGFTSHSLYPASMIAKGMNYSQIIDELIETGVKGR